jgi:hypothetical protein
MVLACTLIERAAPMTAAQHTGKLYPLFTVEEDNARRAGQFFTGAREVHMVGLAIAMFIALFGWGARYFGWDDPDGKVQLALATAFILGIVSGYKTKSDANAPR